MNPTSTSTSTCILGRVHKTGRKAEGLLVHERCRGAFVQGAPLKTPLKPLDPFGSEKKQKVQRFTNNLQGLQKVVVKDFS